MNDYKPLLQGLKHWSAAVRREAAELLGEFGAPHVVDALCLALGDEDYGVRKRATEALVMIGTSAVPSLCQALSSTTFNVRYWAAEALSRIGLPAVDCLCRTIIDGDKRARIWAITALNGMDDQRAIDFLFQTLGELEEAQAVEVLCQLLAEGSKVIRKRAAGALGNLGRREILSVLNSRLIVESGENGDYEVARAIRAAVQQIETATKETKSLPRPAEAPTPDTDILPRPSSAPKFEVDKLPRAAENED